MYDNSTSFEYFIATIYPFIYENMLNIDCMHDLDLRSFDIKTKLGINLNSLRLLENYWGKSIDFCVIYIWM